MSEQDDNRLYIRIYADDEPSRKAEKLYQICGETESQEVAQWLKEYFQFADAVEVVRCKDCKHRHEDECPMQFEEQIDIDEGDGYYDTEYIIHDYTQDDGYCSWGERREP